MDYKSTLNLPKTEFPMKADLPKREPFFLKDWLEKDIYRLILEKSKGIKKYILHDGPPYANGNIHIGHALNKTLKDIIVKYKTMQGVASSYVPGWDCHGLPVEHQLFKEMGINKYQISQLEFRKKAYDYALKFVAVQKEEFKRLGVFGDWDNPYLTLLPDYEESIIRSFGALVKKGYIYRGLKPVNWCFVCETALAEAEVEYENHSSPSIYVKFKLDSESPPQDLAGPPIILAETNQRISESKDMYLVIWTTTPWTLIANVAVAVHPDYIYSFIRSDKGTLIIAKELLPAVLSQIGIDKYEFIREVKGKELEGLSYIHPFGLRKGRVVLADYVSRGEGTGLVHTAPGHGNEDYFTGIKYKLEMVMPVDAKGNFDASTGEFKEMNVFEANKAIIEKLKELKALLFNTSLQHSYPYCWRCKNPVIFRATRQWFLKIDHQGLREKLLQAINENVEWIPTSGKERISAMVQLRPDWCLSRQRYWGVPIPALICKNCQEEFLDPGVIENFAGFVAREGTDSWFQRDVKDFLPSGLICPACKQNNFSKGSDILDVWFDSGVSHQAVLKKRKELEFPCALYLEGSDQHRGWFQSSLIPSMCIDNKSPFKAVLTHGFVVDGEGRKMSKSLGNVIAPQDIIKDYGADILRLWVASSDYNEDIRISPVILSRLAEAYRKIRNTARFALSNLYDFNPDTDKVEYINLKKIDKWILFNMSYKLLESTKKAYEGFEFYKAYQAIYDFCNIELSSYYLDMVKGRLYTYAAKSLERRAAQTAMHETLNTLVRVMAPIMVFTAEEIWQNMPKGKADNNISSVHLLDWPQKNEYLSIIDKNKALHDDTIAFIDLTIIPQIIPIATRLLEEKRASGLIGSSFDAKIIVLTNAEFGAKLEHLKGGLCEIFKVSQVEIKKEAGLENTVIEVLKADGAKCERCWNYSLTVGADKTHTKICNRCLQVIGGKS